MHRGGGYKSTEKQENLIDHISGIKGRFTTLNLTMNTLVQFRTDELIKLQASDLCEEIGIHLATYLRICIIRLVQENGIPFSMKISRESNPGIEAIKAASRIAIAEGISDMTLDEVNAEITEARRSSQNRRSARRCTGDCRRCPPHYGYRYGRWYYGHDHTHGCDFGGNKGSGSGD